MDDQQPVDKASWNKGFSEALEVMSTLHCASVSELVQIREYLGSLQPRSREETKTLSQRVGERGVQEIARELHLVECRTGKCGNRSYNLLPRAKKKIYLEKARAYLDEMRLR